jgi:hypothetical protein
MAYCSVCSLLIAPSTPSSTLLHPPPLQALLGDFDFDELTKEDKMFGPFLTIPHTLYTHYTPYSICRFGPFLFIAFVSVAVFVILNVVIAIIGTAYELTANNLSDMEDVTLGESLVR